LKVVIYLSAIFISCILSKFLQSFGKLSFITQRLANRQENVNVAQDLEKLKTPATHILRESNVCVYVCGCVSVNVSGCLRSPVLENVRDCI
jgi:hypothetical protein